MKLIRVFDIIFSLIGLIMFIPFGILIMIIGYFDTGSPFFVQERIGRNKRTFRLLKFRTMKLGTLTQATHMVNPNSTTRFGRFLRSSKLDELPQLVNVLFGQMSLVGPRPNLLIQDELIRERDARSVYSVRPGITGLAQIQEIDMSTPVKLAQTDEEMISGLNLALYFRLILLTASGKGKGDRIVTSK